MPIREARVGDTVQYRNADGESQNVIVRGIAGAAPQNLVATPVDSGGSLADSTSFGYKVNALVDFTESAASSEDTATTSAVGGNDNRIDLTWDAIPGAVLYNVFRGAPGGNWFFLAAVGSNSYSDTGSASPNPGVPAPTTTDHIGFVGPHDKHNYSSVERATAMHQTDRYYHWW